MPNIQAMSSAAAPRRSPTIDARYCNRSMRALILNRELGGAGDHGTLLIGVVLNCRRVPNTPPGRAVRRSRRCRGGHSVVLH
jgi:hypothetical protein